jgi:heme-degrading monooxygenase HmoA
MEPAQGGSMVVTVFRSRLRPEARDEYTQWATRMSEMARALPGYISHKVFVAEDGERVTIVEFETPDQHRVWATHPEHLAAKKKGREGFYSEYSIQVCTVERAHAFRSPLEALAQPASAQPGSW